MTGYYICDTGGEYTIQTEAKTNNGNHTFK